MRITQNTCSILIVALLFSGCGLLLHPGTAFTLLFGEGEIKNPNVYHVGKHGWTGDSISIQLYKTADPSERGTIPNMTVECASCNIIRGSVPISFNANGYGTVYIPESRDLISARLHISGKGIDTTFIQTQRSPQEATSYFHLSKPLIGRVLVERLALLYVDTSQDSVAATATIGDELNIYGEDRNFYSVQEPKIPAPLYILKSDAFRIE